jgi:DNA replication protein
MKSNLLSWLQEGNLTIPVVLFSEYRNLNLNEYELVLLINILSFIEKGNEFPTPEELSSRMTVSVLECNEMLRRLVQRGYIEIIDECSNEGIRYERYSLNPLWEKLVDQFLMNNNHSNGIKRKQMKPIFTHALKGNLAVPYHLLNAKRLPCGWMMTTMIQSS